jgi:hypothetical protein
MRGDGLVLVSLLAALGCTGTIDEPDPIVPITPLLEPKGQKRA